MVLAGTLECGACSVGYLRKSCQAVANVESSPIEAWTHLWADVTECERLVHGLLG